jgi:hypothetical protein
VTVVYNLKKKEVLKLNFIIFLIGPIICFGQVDFSNKEYWQQKILNDNILPMVRQSLNEEFTEFNDITRIPEDLIKILETWKGSEISFANPNEEYNKTDVVDDLLPNRQLTSIYLNLNHAFVLYNHGGFGFHKHIIWCEFDEEKIIDIWICNYNTTITDISSIKAFLDNFTRTHKLSDGRLLRENYVCY